MNILQNPRRIIYIIPFFIPFISFYLTNYYITLPVSINKDKLLFSLALCIFECMIFIAAYIFDLTMKIDKDFEDYHSKVKNYNESNKALSTAINNLNSKSELLGEILPKTIIDNASNIIDSVLKLVASDCLHLKCEERCEFTNRNCIFKNFFQEEIKRFISVKANIEKDIYYIDTNDPDAHRKIVIFMKQHDIRSYSVIQFIDNGTSEEFKEDIDFFRTLLRDGKDLEINWLLLESNRSRLNEMAITPFKYAVKLVCEYESGFAENNVTIEFRRSELGKFNFPMESKNFIDFNSPDVGLYCETSLRNKHGVSKLKNAFYFSARVEKGNGGRQRYVFVKNNTVADLVSEFIKIWNNNSESEKIELSFLKDVI